MTNLATPGVAFFSISVALTGLLQKKKPCPKRGDPLPTSTKSKENGRVVKNNIINQPSYKDFHVIIIGGGIGGLATALALQREGISCKVYERDRVFEDRKQGYGLTLSNTPTGGLARLGILDECIRRDCASNAHWVFTPEGEVIGYYGRAFKPEKSIDGTTHRSKHRGNLRIPRQDIRQLLLSRLLPDTVQWSHRCLSIQEEEEGHATVTFEDGSSARGDVVVGADGLRSRVRRLRDECLAASRSGGRTGRKEEVKEQQEASGEIDYIGVSVTLGISSFKHPLLQKQGFYVLDGTHRLFTMPFREDEGGTVQTMWQLSFSGLSEGEANLLKMSGSRAQLADAVRRTAGWFPCVQALIQSTSEADTWSTPLYDRPPMASHAKQERGSRGGSRVTVLGDAAHPMSMFKGQGANQALEDAPRLVEWLLKQGKQFSSLSIPARLRHFEKEMRDRTCKWVTASRAASQALHCPAVMDTSSSSYGIDGLSTKQSEELMKALRRKGVTAVSHADLEGRVLEENQEILLLLEQGHPVRETEKSSTGGVECSFVE